MDVAHITSVHPRNDVRIFRKECRTLVAAGYEVKLLVADGNGNEISDGVAVIDVGLERGGRWQRMTRTRRHDPELLPVGVSLQRQGKRVIYDAHELLPASIRSKHYLPKLSRWVAAHLIGNYERFVARRLSAVIAATPVIARRLGQVQHRTEVVANYPELKEVGAEPVTWDRRKNLVCYQGAISWERGLREMVAAITQADCRLLLAGRYSDEMDCVAVRQLPGWEAVEEMGTLDHSRLRAMMYRCRIGLVLFHPHPNHLEAQPNKLFEYMAAGLPVIASDFPMWRELIEDWRCGICVDPMDPKAIAKGINWLFDHPEEADAMGRRGRKAIWERYNWESEARKLLALYDSLA